MNGCIIPKTPFAVDFWKARECRHTRLFFLSHMHADHTSGLSPSWKHPIYCSEITAKLLIHKFNIDPSLVHTLEVGESHVLPLDETGQETMTVTVLDANHCPGAVMFLFEGYFGSVFYTGDFRYSAEMFDHEVLASRPSIDVLYLDNTYCSPQCKFPSRKEATQMMKDIISRHPEHDIVLGMTKLGKEEMLVELAQTFQTWVVVTPQRLETLKLLELPNVFTTDPEAGRIRVVMKYQVTRKNVERWNEERPTIAILPSALYTGLDGQPYANQTDVHIVPYSDHSSYRELHDFVSRLKPRSIIPVVKGTSRGVFGTSLQERADMHCFDNYLDPSPVRTFQIPESVGKFMYSGSHSSIVDVFTDNKACKRNARSIRNCVPAPNGRPMGVVFIDSPQKMSEKAKCAESVNTENESKAVLEEKDDNTSSKTSLSLKYMKQSESGSEDCTASDAAEHVVNSRTSRKRKLPPSIAIPAQTVAYRTGQEQNGDIDKQKCIQQQLKKNNSFAIGDGRKRKLPTGLLMLSQQKGGIPVVSESDGQDSITPPALSVPDVSTDHTSSEALVDGSTWLSVEMLSESENVKPSKRCKTMITPPRDKDFSMTYFNNPTQSEKKRQLTLDAFFPKTVEKRPECCEAVMVEHSHRHASHTKRKSVEHDRELTELMPNKTCKERTEDTESHKKSVVRNGSAETGSADVVYLTNSDVSVESKSPAQNKYYNGPNCHTTSRSNGRYAGSGGCSKAADMGYGGTGRKVPTKQAVSSQSKEHLECVEDEIIQSLVLEDKEMCSQVRKKKTMDFLEKLFL